MPARRPLTQHLPNPPAGRINTYSYSYSQQIYYHSSYIYIHILLTLLKYRSLSLYIPYLQPCPLLYPPFVHCFVLLSSLCPLLCPAFVLARTLRRLQGAKMLGTVTYAYCPTSVHFTGLYRLLRIPISIYISLYVLLYIYDCPYIYLLK